MPSQSIIESKQYECRRYNAVDGIITLVVEWGAEVRDMKFLVVAGLQQTLYLGIDFCKIFGLSVVATLRHSASIHVCNDLETR